MAIRTSSRLIELADAVGWRSRIPPPCGPFLVNRMHLRIPGEHGVFCQLFFPMNLVGKGTDKSSLAETVPNDDVILSATRIYRSTLHETPKLLFDIFAGTLPPRSVPTPLKESITHANQLPQALPLVLFSHGLIGNCEIYSKTCSDLASHGLIVVALEHEDGSGAFVRSVTGDAVRYRLPPLLEYRYDHETETKFRAPFLLKREKEIRRTVEFFCNEKREAARYHKRYPNLYLCLESIHPEYVFLAGHSFGAATSVHTVRAWPARFKGIILMDVWPYPIPNIEDGVKNVPICSVLSEQFATRKESTLIRELLTKSDDVRASFYARGTFHIAFSDMPWWASVHLAQLALKRVHAHPLPDPARVQKRLNDVYVKFIDGLVEVPHIQPQSEPAETPEDDGLLVPFS